MLVTQASTLQNPWLSSEASLQTAGSKRSCEQREVRINRLPALKLRASLVLIGVYDRTHCNTVTRLPCMLLQSLVQRYVPIGVCSKMGTICEVLGLSAAAQVLAITKRTGS